MVIGARIFSRKGADKDTRTEAIERAEIDKLLKDQHDEIRIIRESARGKLATMLDGQTVTMPVKDQRREDPAAEGAQDYPQGLWKPSPSASGRNFLWTMRRPKIAWPNSAAV